MGFESRFESGNLKSAYVIDKYNYELFLNYDTNNIKYSSWFFFQVFNIEKNKKYTFNINNISGGKILYNFGTWLFAYS